MNNPIGNLNNLYECSLFSYTDAFEDLKTFLLDLNYDYKPVKIHRLFYKKDKSTFVHDLVNDTLVQRTGPIQDRNRTVTAYKTCSSNLKSGQVDKFLRGLNFVLEKEVKQQIEIFKLGDVQIEVFYDEQKEIYFVQIKIVTHDLISGENILKRFKEDSENILQFIKIF